MLLVLVFLCVYSSSLSLTLSDVPFSFHSTFFLNQRGPQGRSKQKTLCPVNNLFPLHNSGRPGFQVHSWNQIPAGPLTSCVASCQSITYHPQHHSLPPWNSDNGNCLKGLLCILNEMVCEQDTRKHSRNISFFLKKKYYLFQNLTQSPFSLITDP